MMSFGAYMVGCWGLLLGLLGVWLVVDGFRLLLVGAGGCTGRLGGCALVGGLGPAVVYAGWWFLELSVRGAA